MAAEDYCTAGKCPSGKGLNEEEHSHIRWIVVCVALLQITQLLTYSLRDLDRLRSLRDKSLRIEQKEE